MRISSWLSDDVQQGDLICEGVQKRGLPAAGRPHDGEEFASLRLAAYPLDDMCLPNGTGNILRVKNTIQCT